MSILLLLISMVLLMVAPAIAFLCLWYGMQVLANDALINTLNENTEDDYSTVTLSDAASSVIDGKTGSLQFPSSKNTNSSTEETEWKYY